LLVAAIRDQDPVVFLEPKSRYWSREDFEPAANGDGYAARIVRTGRHATLLAWGACVERCLEAAEWAAEDGVELEVVDLRWLKPLDAEAIVESVSKTGRAVVVHEAPLTLGLGAEVSSLLMERCFRSLKAPVARVGGPDMPYPCAALEEDYLPGPDRILLAVQRTLSS
jgi:2-oxoisovalerate dehydrogenase E1 component beta subunit